MSERDPGVEAFSKFIVALEPWLGEVVLVGGWAHRLYRLAIDPGLQAHGRGILGRRVRPQPLLNGADSNRMVIADRLRDLREQRKPKMG
jgi:hypothetical protein